MSQEHDEDDAPRFGVDRRRAADRPSPAAEIRAWVGVGLVLAIQIVGGVWWAATLSSQNASMKDLLVEVRGDMKGFALKTDVDRQFESQRLTLQDHETRIRLVESRKTP